MLSMVTMARDEQGDIESDMFLAEVVRRTCISPERADEIMCGMSFDSVDEAVEEVNAWVLEESTRPAMRFWMDCTSSAVVITRPMAAKMLVEVRKARKEGKASIVSGGHAHSVSMRGRASAGFLLQRVL